MEGLAMKSNPREVAVVAIHVSALPHIYRMYRINSRSESVCIRLMEGGIKEGK